MASGPAVTGRPAGLLRRLAALVYDSLLLLAVWFVLTATLLPLTGGEAIRHNPFYTSLLFLAGVGFYGWFWSHGGQTLGMRSWHLQLRNLRPGPVSPWQILLRALVAIPSFALFGLGYLWMLVDRDRLTWHDRYSETTVVRLERNPLGR
ncbi:MAG TPA: RDD family protein [Gammaproteobacteria bacterium]|nr:RDD family protein [Gammaproteobacteria bacterium]